MLDHAFTTVEQNRMDEEFLENGYIVETISDIDLLVKIRHFIVRTACEILDTPLPSDQVSLLNEIHNIVTVKNLNDFRMALFSKLNQQSWLRPSYFKLGKDLIEKLVGNELAMQNQVNFSIQMPHDASSLIELHSDTFSGETPFPVVQWVPLVDAYETKSMYILPPLYNNAIFPKIRQIIDQKGIECLFN